MNTLLMRLNRAKRERADLIQMISRKSDSMKDNCTANDCQQTTGWISEIYALTETIKVLENLLKNMTPDSTERY